MVYFRITNVTQLRGTAILEIADPSCFIAVSAYLVLTPNCYREMEFQHAVKIRAARYRRGLCSRDYKRRRLFAIFTGRHRSWRRHE